GAAARYQVPLGVPHMRNIGVFVLAGAFAAVLSSPSPSAAFGLRLGPLHLGLPFFGGHHFSHHRHRAIHAASHKGAIYDKADYETPAVKPAGKPAINPSWAAALRRRK